MCVVFYWFCVCLSVYAYDSKFTAGVPSCRELHGHLITAHHSYVFSTFREGSRCGTSTKKTNKQAFHENRKKRIQRRLTTRLVQWLGWVFENQRKKDRKPRRSAIFIVGRQRSGTVSWVLHDSSSAHHSPSPRQVQCLGWVVKIQEKKGEKTHPFPPRRKRGGEQKVKVQCSQISEGVVRLWCSVMRVW